MNNFKQTKIVEGWRSGWRCDRIRNEAGDRTLTNKQISDQMHILIPKWHEFVSLCKIMRTEPTYYHFEQKMTNHSR